jgi:hypothetical protein
VIRTMTVAFQSFPTGSSVAPHVSFTVANYGTIWWAAMIQRQPQLAEWVLSRTWTGQLVLNEGEQIEIGKHDMPATTIYTHGSGALMPIES